MNRPSGTLSTLQYTYVAPYLIADLYKRVMMNGLPATGENRRKALLAIK